MAALTADVAARWFNLATVASTIEARGAPAVRQRGGDGRDGRRQHPCWDRLLRRA